MNQKKFIENAEIFLNALTSHWFGRKTEEKETLGENIAGLCHGLTIMLIRAWMIGEQKHYIERWLKFCKMSPREVKKSAELVKKHRHFCQLLGRDGLGFLEKLQKNYWKQPGSNSISRHLRKLVRVIKDIQDQKKLLVNTITNDQSFIVKSNISKLKDEYQTLIKKIVCEKEFIDANKLPKENKLSVLENELDFSLEIRAYISSVLFIQDLEKISILIQDKERGVERRMRSGDIVESIKILAPDVGVSIWKALSFAFTFKEDDSKLVNSGSQELLHTLKNAIYDGDFVYMYSRGLKNNTLAGHAIYLMRQNNEWLVIDPNGAIEPRLLQDEELTSEVSRQLFFNVGLTKLKGYLPIGFFVFEKTAVSPLIRPTLEDLVNAICALRPKNELDINVGLSTNQSALRLAVGDDNLKLVEALLNRGALSNYKIIDMSHTNAVRYKLLTGGIGGMLERNWPALPVAALMSAFYSLGAKLLDKNEHTCVYIAILLVIANTIYKYEGKSYYDEKSLQMNSITNKVSDYKKTADIRFFSTGAVSNSLTKSQVSMVNFGHR